MEVGNGRVLLAKQQSWISSTMYHVMVTCDMSDVACDQISKMQYLCSPQLIPQLQDISDHLRFFSIRLAIV